jgi:hypothetical protein
MEIKLHMFLILALDGSFVIATVLPAEKSHPNGVSVGLGEPHGRSRYYDEKCEYQLRMKSLSNIP